MFLKRLNPGFSYIVTNLSQKVPARHRLVFIYYNIFLSFVYSKF
nr:MAG TPA: hypothetical protein [Caudoviricetes sp.]